MIKLILLDLFYAAVETVNKSQGIVNIMKLKVKKFLKASFHCKDNTVELYLQGSEKLAVFYRKIKKFLRISCYNSR